MSNACHDRALDILLIEDNDELRLVLGRVLSAAGYEVESVENGHRALEVMRSRGFDLLITDMILPGPEGIEIILSARTMHPSMKIIAMSGGSLDGGRDYLPLAAKLGAAAVLPKPFGREELLDAVGRLLDSGASVGAGGDGFRAAG